MATYFKVVLADMTIPLVKPGMASPLLELSYSAIIANLEQKLTRITKLIPKVFSTAFVVFSPFDAMPSVSPDDVLVLIEGFPERTSLSNADRDRAVNDNSVGGMTILGDPAGVSMVVWLNRCGPTVDRLTSNIIHEIGHAKSGLDDAMHDQNPKGILAKGGGSPGRTFLDSDALWLSKYLQKKLTFNMKHFAAN